MSTPGREPIPVLTSMLKHMVLPPAQVGDWMPPQTLAPTSSSRASGHPDSDCLPRAGVSAYDPGVSAGLHSKFLLGPQPLRTQVPGCTFPFTWCKRAWHTAWPVLEPESRLHLLGKVFLIYCLFSNFESEVAQSCLTLFDPMDCSPPGSSVHGISQARILEWIAISFSRGSS